MGVAWWNLQSQLLVAIQNDDETRAKQLLAAGVDCDARFHFGTVRRPAVCLCVERDSLSLVRLLLDWGCSVNQSDSKGLTALHLAAGRGHVELLDLLLKNRASVRALDEQKRTALHWAAQRIYPRIAQLLLQHGSAVDCLDQDGKTPLLLACLNGCSETAKLLLQYGASPSAVDHLGNTALHFAVDASTTDTELVRALIQAGASVNAVNVAGLTPLHVAVRGMHSQSRSQVLKMLAAAGCHLDQPTPLGQTALHTAVLERDTQSAIALLRLQARADTVDSLGLPPLFHAARDGNHRLVKALLAAGALSWRSRLPWSQQLIEWGIRDPVIFRWISEAASTCPRLTSLSRTAFRAFAGQHSAEFAARLQYPPVLVEFIDYYDLNEPDP